MGQSTPSDSLEKRRGFCIIVLSQVQPRATCHPSCGSRCNFKEAQTSAPLNVFFHYWVAPALKINKNKRRQLTKSNGQCERLVRQSDGPVYPLVNEEIKKLLKKSMSRKTTPIRTSHRKGPIFRFHYLQKYFNTTQINKTSFLCCFSFPFDKLLNKLPESLLVMALLLSTIFFHLLLLCLQFLLQLQAQLR